ncbi:MAG: CYTH domain-containing protein [Prevotella sp.]|nr:CYTH domain-containing protein [Bacteroides sp.]MCM1365854.1 CYTH domain-containing protein [Prevotella sp.]
MATEIEHKYLVISSDYEKLATKRFIIAQGYLSRDKERIVRVRVKGDKGYLTVKGVTKGDSRLEYEYEIPIEDAEEMLKLCEGKIIRKERYIVPYKGYDWEVDKFLDNLAPLCIAEIELSESNRNYPKPSFIGKDVTGDPKYYNSSL